ncbi:hypothetical protein [uncultured Draconibacterium sp.]|uniref:esterase/lipase family protein n=1 Tax=uncultured Draconibacterium sp. TaxID=1573823 RepID=UPI0032167737
MAKVIIGIHGLGNKPSKEILEKWWRMAIEEGLIKAGHQIKPFIFELVYWADLMYEKPLDLEISDKDSPYYLLQKYMPGPEILFGEDHPKRKKILDFLTKQLDSIFLNEDFSLNYTYLTDTILQRYFKDLDIYYKEKCKDEDAQKCEIKKVIRQRTKTILEKYKKDEIVLIGHSMGSIIAYDVLSFSEPATPVNTFITIGSPLGIPIVKSKIAKELEQNHFNKTQLTTPPSVFKNWFNFSDIEDKVAIDYQLGDDFAENKLHVKPIDFEVYNDYTINGERNPHKSYGYLRTPKFSEKINEFLQYRKPTVWNKLTSNIRKLLIKQARQASRHPQHL